MPAGITVPNGVAEAAFAREPAWHGMGQVVKEVMTSEEAIKLAHLDWPVEQWDVSAMPPDGKQAKNVNEYVANVRGDTELVLGLVGRRYQIIQNTQSFNFLDQLVADGELKYEAFGSLWEGRAIWILAVMPQIDTVATGDVLQQYILWMNRHDGTGSAIAAPTSVRVVCANTFNLALTQLTANKAKKLYVRHVGDVGQKLDQARQVMGLCQAASATYVEYARRLAKTSIAADDLARYVRTMFPLLPDDGDRTVKRIHKDRASVTDLFDDPTNRLPSMRGTAWAALNAMTLFADHYATIRAPDEAVRADRRFASTLLSDGSLSKFKSRASDVAQLQFLDGEDVEALEIHQRYEQRMAEGVPGA